MVIVGHSSDFPWSDGKYKNVFALLDKLAVGDKIVVTYGSEKYIYQVTGSKVVKPTDLSVLKKTASPTLTLLTCYPVGSTRSRLIVTAKLLSDNAGSVQTTDPLTGESLPRPR
jgi:sortase A